jgi:hypothetical protein
MILLISLLYLLHPLALPAGTTAVLGPTSSQAAMEPVLYRRPTTVSISRDGTVGLVVGESEEHAFDRVYVFRNGASVAIPLVPKSLLGRFFLSVYNEEHGTTGFNEALLTQVRNLVIGDDDTLFVGISSSVEGAYSAEQDASFKWSSLVWLPSPSVAFSESIPKNVWVAAADGTADIGYVADRLYLDPASQARLTPDALDDVAVWAHSGSLTLLGTGVITAVCGNRVVGYDAHYVPSGIDVKPTSDAVLAEEWNGGRHSLLGYGLAWSVNADGDVVGDDRTTLKSVGYPTLWHKGKAIRLSSAHGSAFAIANDGTIVGDEVSGAFIIRAEDPKRQPVLLDSLLTGSGWHVRAAYAISANGDILALASRKGADHMVLLVPNEDDRLAIPGWGG